MERVIVHTKNPCSRYYTGYRIHIGLFIFHCIEHAFWYLFLLQNEDLVSADALANNPKFKNRPVSVTSYASTISDVKHPESAFQAPSIYMAILKYLVDQGNNDFTREFGKIAERLRLTGQRPVRFVVPNSHHERKWSCGLRTANILRGVSANVGLNLYGKVLDQVFKWWHQSRALPEHASIQRLSESLCFSGRPYRKTALILSDSYAKFVSKVEGGTVVSISGGKYDDLAYEVQRRGIFLGDYKVVIVNCGFNCSSVRNTWTKTQSYWMNLWKPLEELLVKSANLAPHLQVIMSSGIGVPKARGDLQGHTSFIKHRFISTFHDDGVVGNGQSRFYFMDFSKKQDNPFMDAQEMPRSELFDKEEQKERDSNGKIDIKPAKAIHLNHAGFRILWLTWAECVPEMYNLSYENSAVHYRQV